MKKRNATGACRKTLYAESRAKRDRSERKSIKDRAKGGPVCGASSQRQPPYGAGAEHTEKKQPRLARASIGAVMRWELLPRKYTEFTL